METINKSYVVDFYLDGCYLKSKSLMQDRKLQVGEIVDINLPKSDCKVMGQVVDTLDMSEDEYHLYLRTL